MKQLSLITLYFFSSIVINAQIIDQISLGIYGGLTYSNILQKNDLSGNYDFKPGFNSGLSVELKLESNICIQTNICYYQNGYNFNVRETLRMPDFIFSESYLRFENRKGQNYLNNSWLVGYSIGDKIEFSIYAGPYWATFLSSNYKTKSIVFVDPEEWIEYGDTTLPIGYKETTYDGKNNMGYSSFDFGVTGWIEFGIYLYQRYQFACLLSYNQGFVDINKQVLLHEIKHYNSSFNFGLGLNIRL